MPKKLRQEQRRAEEPRFKKNPKRLIDAGKLNPTNPEAMLMA